ncbi:hypothetical protein MMC09_004190 [Bachmanniomyces sp. S44760]|nr:hypothetical protein [Bachmanniomyces sp. S44760]
MLSQLSLHVDSTANGTDPVDVSDGELLGEDLGYICLGDCTNPKHNMTNSDTVDSSLVGPHPHHIAMKKIRDRRRPSGKRAIYSRLEELWVEAYLRDLQNLQEAEKGEIGIVTPNWAKMTIEFNGVFAGTRRGNCTRPTRSKAALKIAVERMPFYPLLTGRKARSKEVGFRTIKSEPEGEKLEGGEASGSDTV